MAEQLFCFNWILLLKDLLVLEYWIPRIVGLERLVAVPVDSLVRKLCSSVLLNSVVGPQSFLVSEAMKMLPRFGWFKNSENSVSPSYCWSSPLPRKKTNSSCTIAVCMCRIISFISTGSINISGIMKSCVWYDQFLKIFKDSSTRHWKHFFEKTTIFNEARKHLISMNFAIRIRATNFIFSKFIGMSCFPCRNLPFSSKKLFSKFSSLSLLFLFSFSLILLDDSKNRTTLLEHLTRPD